MVDDLDQQNAETGSQYQTNSFNDNDSGYVQGEDGIKEPGANYFSPWDIWFNRGYTDQQPSYYFNNGNSENPSPYRLEVYAWVGLAYFDGIDDGKFHDDLNAATPTLVADMFGNAAQYTNLFASGHEVGNLVRTAAPIDLDPLDEFRIEDKFNHLQMFDPFGLGLTLPLNILFKISILVAFYRPTKIFY